ncbi:Protein of unknown function [Rhizobium sp. NFR07]|uniref:DUF2793 domain-containing protein n=1 Tax=Rhizobium sp. NFR07 TaxID=1566262 RepID=UPI0008E4D02A|nr:DUF2793 domain-containing protein [Rhizobium sp. NFR07]SFB51940.1 Protein of unknown function [Rhizobium sp. NFR07]
MNDRTVNLDMPFLMPSQAQKHVTHNEALLRLDAIVQLSIVDERASPPSEPSPGSRYLVGADAAGTWSGYTGDIAIWQDGYWAFASPNPGWHAWFETGSALKVFDGEAWHATSLPDDAEVATLGISTSADATNRIAVSSPASLFSHAGGGHQIKVNKAVQADTATLLFQSGWIGHAEMGLAGNNDFSIKTSNGTDWKTGLTIDGAGRVTRPNQPAARVHRSGSNFTPAAGQQSGVTDFAINQGGFTLGAAAAAGGNALVVPATGLYFIALTVSVAAATSAYGVTVSRNGSQPLLATNGAAGSLATLSASGISQLQQGDTLTFGHSGSATLAVGANGTILSLTMI